MSRAAAYAQAKGRDVPQAVRLPDAALEARVAAEMRPLSDDEQAAALANWHELKKLTPEFAEFVQELAKRPDFNGRRALAGMTIRRLPADGPRTEVSIDDDSTTQE